MNYSTIIRNPSLPFSFTSYNALSACSIRLFLLSRLLGRKLAYPCEIVTAARILILYMQLLQFFFYRFCNGSDRIFFPVLDEQNKLVSAKSVCFPTFFHGILQNISNMLKTTIPLNMPICIIMLFKSISITPTAIFSPVFIACSITSTASFSNI